MACIRSKKGEKLQNASNSINYKFYEYLRWAPVVDKSFLLETPQNLRNKGTFEKVKLMISFNSQEGGKAVAGMAGNVDDGASPSLFKEFLATLAHGWNSRYK